MLAKGFLDWNFLFRPQLIGEARRELTMTPIVRNSFYDRRSEYSKKKLKSAWFLMFPHGISGDTQYHCKLLNVVLEWYGCAFEGFAESSIQTYTAI